MKEDIKSDFMRNSECAIYKYTIAQTEYERVISEIKGIEAQKDFYKYNFLGLFGVLLRIKIDRPHAMFCSQFVATVLNDSASARFIKEPCFITPADIRNMEGMELIYRGSLGHYQSQSFLTHDKEEAERETGEQSSFKLNITRQIKRFVMR
ncbi:hypothetical protein JNUCC1_01288 [Lentibacillus sp. JNUCC-1]|uniref:hypothetical protein n=1 Tax=Lentibacillus sp. JNUCC-1 TaxID=2654513 RepID=UPI0013285835|nr:hypothetical protein [Lentibacillus sp. JNUCC-1]MUV37482.1 hypothetical protein [Lentibacillus sp. JNUCC-1]